MSEAQKEARKEAESDDHASAFAWAEYRHGIEPNRRSLGREAVAFKSGWDAALRRGAPAEHAVQITDRMVERAARALNPEAWAVYDSSDSEWRESLVAHTKAAIRPILEAALNGADDGQ